MRGGGTRVSGVASEAGRPKEHPLLGMPRRDAVVTVVLVLATAVVFVLVANHRTRPSTQGLDGAFLKRMLAVRTGGLTGVAQVMNFLGLVYVTLPVRLAIAGYLALRRRWWHLAAFASAIIVSEALISPLKTLYQRPVEGQYIAVVYSPWSTSAEGPFRRATPWQRR